MIYPMRNDRWECENCVPKYEDPESDCNHISELGGDRLLRIENPEKMEISIYSVKFASERFHRLNNFQFDCVRRGELFMQFLNCLATHQI